jgi:dimeric dUTPase (all-alpha-NTP-PPase superfamily)
MAEASNEVQCWPRWRTASNSSTPAVTETFSDEIVPARGIETV